MPIYEYVCKSCGKKTEVIQNYSDKPLVVCPHCGKRALKKAFSAPAIQFKGSGWYVTDYARSGNKESKDSASRGEKSDKSDKGEKAEKADKSEKSEKSDKPASDEKAGKSDKVAKADKTERKKPKE